VYSALDEIMT
jgi:glutamate dehydrogenase/leucine dehydrogenase